MLAILSPFCCFVNRDINVLALYLHTTFRCYIIATR
nr:MAG TPA: hypothetical protein [Caudoviricetes sp.]